MITVLPIDTTHIIKLIYRYIPIDAIVLTLYNETTKDETIVANTYTITNGVMSVTFDFTFVENDKYQIKLSNNEGVIYRGKLIATSQDTQNFKQTNDLYYYE